MRALHLGNIANMAFSYCDILRSYGDKDECVSYDLTHPCSVPDNSLKTHSSEHLDWYYFIKTKKRVQEINADFYLGWIKFLEEDFDLSRHHSYFYNNLVQERVINDFFISQDMAFGYSYASIPLMINGSIPYVPVEIGNFRDIHFKNDAFSQLFLASCLCAPHVIITNPDTYNEVQKVGLKSYSFIPHPVNEDLWRRKPQLLISSEWKNLKSNVDLLVVAPARHDWVDKGNDRYIKAFARLVKDGVNARLVLNEWGKDIDKSKKLISELDISQKVKWFPLLPEQDLLKLFNVADVIIDQCGIPDTFGMITPKAMSCGLPVITKYKHKINKWAFPERPPLLAAEDEDSIFSFLKSLACNYNAYKDLSSYAREWIKKYHSKNVVKQKFDEVKKIVKNKKGNYETFNRLVVARKKWEQEACIQMDYKDIKQKLLEKIDWIALKKIRKIYPDIYISRLVKIIFGEA